MSETKAPSNEDCSFERITELKEQVDEECQEIDIANISAVLEPTKKRARKSITYNSKLEGAPPSPFPSFLDGGSVRVDNPHHIASIYTAGYFGKGSVSRGKPSISEQDEALILSPVEAFYLLKYKVIHIMGEAGKFSKQKIWSLFCNDPLFPHKYAVFEHFRAKAWVVRSGLKYGADYMLYQGGPGETHASYAVKCFSSQCTPDWDVVNCLRRVNETVAKELVLCYVAFKGTTGTSTCLKLCDVTSIMVKRWLPERDREAKVPKQKKKKQSKGTKEEDEIVNLIDPSETSEADSTLKEGSVELGKSDETCVEGVDTETGEAGTSNKAMTEPVSDSASHHEDSMIELGEGVKDLSTDDISRLDEQVDEVSVDPVIDGALEESGEQFDKESGLDEERMATEEEGVSKMEVEPELVTEEAEKAELEAELKAELEAELEAEVETELEAELEAEADGESLTELEALAVQAEVESLTELEIEAVQADGESLTELEALAVQADGESGAELWKEGRSLTEAQAELRKVLSMEEATEVEEQLVNPTKAALECILDVPLATPSRYNLQSQYLPLLHPRHDMDCESVTDSMVVHVDDIQDISALEESSSRAEEETSFSTQNIEITSTFLEENIEAESTTIEGDLTSEDLNITPCIDPDITASNITAVSYVKEVSVNADTSTETIDLAIEEEVVEQVGEQTGDIIENIFREEEELEEVAEATLEAARVATPEATLEATPEATLEATPEATLEATPEATPEATLEATPEGLEKVYPVQGVEDIAEIILTVEEIFQEDVIKSDKSHDTLNEGYLDITENKENVERSEEGSQGEVDSLNEAIIEETNSYKPCLDSVSLPESDVPLATPSRYSLQSQYLPLQPIRRSDSMIVNIDSAPSIDYTSSVTSLELTQDREVEEEFERGRDEAAGEGGESPEISIIEAVRDVKEDSTADEELDVGQAEDELTFAGSCTVEEEEEESRKRPALSRLFNPSKLRRLDVSARPSIHQRKGEERGEEKLETSCLIQ